MWCVFLQFRLICQASFFTIFAIYINSKNLNQKLYCHHISTRPVGARKGTIVRVEKMILLSVYAFLLLLIPCAFITVVPVKHLQSHTDWDEVKWDTGVTSLFFSSLLINSQWSCGKSHMNSFLSLPAKTDAGKRSPLKTWKAKGRKGQSLIFFQLSTMLLLTPSHSFPCLYIISFL